MAKRSPAAAVKAVKPCRACGKPIPRTAKLCAHCDSHQSRWLRPLQIAASMVGLLTIVGLVSGYAEKLIPAARKAIHWRSKLEVIGLHSGRQEVTVMNVGDGPVFLSHVQIVLPGVGVSLIPIKKRADVNQVVMTSPAPPNARQTDRILINHASPEEWMRAISATHWDDGENCVQTVVYADNDASYGVYLQADREDPHDMPQLEATAVLHYHDLKTGPGTQRIPAHALLFVRRDCLNRLGLRSMQPRQH